MKNLMFSIVSASATAAATIVESGKKTKKLPRAKFEDAQTCFLNSLTTDRLRGCPAGYEPPLFDETEHSCGSLNGVTDRDVSEDKGTAPVLTTASEKSPGDGQSGSAKGFWAQLRAMAGSEQNLRLTFKRVNGQPGLVAMYRGIRCFLPKGEMPRNFDIEFRAR